MNGRTIVLAMLSSAAFVTHARGGGFLDVQPRVEPQADTLLKRMSDCLARTRQFTFEARDMVDEVLDSGQKIQISSNRRIAVRRPDRISAEITGDLRNERAWYDGRTVTLLDLQRNEYGTVSVPDNIDDMFDHLAERLGVAFPLADLLFSDPYGTVIGGVRSGWYVGLHQVGQDRCHHLAFQQDAVDWQIWIQDGPLALPRKLVITYKSSPGQPQFIAFFDHWNLEAQLADTMFVFQAPEGARQVPIEPLVTKAGRPAPEMDQPDVQDPRDR